MMRFDTFGRTVAFGAAAAVGWVPWVMAAEPVIGAMSARTLYLITVTAIYIAGLSAAPRHLMPAVVALASASTFAAFAGTTSSLVVMLAVILGVSRSGFLYAAPIGPAVAREAILLGGGLLLARFVADAAVVSTGSALWSFFLVQALFFLTPGHHAAIAHSPIDPFEAAYRRALNLLEEHDVAP